MSDDLILTEELIGKLATDRGGFTKSTLDAIGVPWDDEHRTPVKGWRRALIGRRVTQVVYNAAIAGRTKPNRKRQVDSDVDNLFKNAV